MSSRKNAPSPAPSLTDVALGQRTGYLFIKAGELALRLAEDALAASGLRARHFNVMTMINMGRPLSQQEVGDILGIDKNLIVAVIDDLEGRELVRRERSLEDRRRYVLELTPKGKRLLKEAYAHVERAEREFLAPLTASEVPALRDALSRIVAPWWPVKKPR
ncbi:MarR family winged helix-turn-helix transcriptional regulator [Pendulispora albinea]|uniref:MarR family transcriptional regulator n=1 Tax=Pendulispora albinea TaxID=2741071 RepID=A0ABZ2MB18_9BACT